MTAKANDSTRIGLVLVHGVGEQRRFDHLSGEVKNLVAALSTVPNVRVSVETRNTQDAEVGAEREAWRVDGSAPVKIHVAHDILAQRCCLCVHEVWWADLDDKETLRNRFKFWFWGLGFWGVRKLSRATLQGAQLDMQPPEFPPFPWGNAARELMVRLRLWAFANVFLLSALTVNVLNYALRRFRLGELPGVEVFYQFVGDVKLYQDRGKPQLGPLTDLGDPRRVAIRRRMVRVLIDAYRARYERWYVLAHSLGTVVAWNGLMETAHALPNYLSQETWASLKAAHDPVLGPRQDGQGRSVNGMRPRRPVWIEDDNEVLRREILFARLRGLVTYGSPLDKFAYLWSQIVNINKDTKVFRDGFEWVNVYEHTDPVASSLSAYTGPNIPAGSPAPQNYAYKASPILLLSHLAYLRLRSSGNDHFVQRLLAWIVDGNARFRAPTPADPHWYRRPAPAFGLLLRTPWWLAGTAVFALALADLGIPAMLEVTGWITGLPLIEEVGLQGVIETLSAGFASLSLGERMLGVLVAGGVLVTLAGIARNILDR